MYRQPRVTLLLAVILIVILCGVGWLSVEANRNEAIIVEHQQQSFINSQIQTAETTIAGLIQQLEVQLQADAQRFGLDAQSSEQIIRDYLRQSPLVGFIYIANADGDRVFPAVGAISNFEMDYLHQTQELWGSLELFTDNTNEESLASVKKGEYSINKANSRQQQAVIRSFDNLASGWLNWVGADQQSNIFWIKDNKGRLIVFDLVIARLLSDVINRLPDDSSVASVLPDGAMRLLDDRNRVLYQWGTHTIAEGESSAGYRYLSQPFRNWKLEFFHPAKSLQGTWSQRIFTYGGFSLALVLLFIYLYKEQTRALREAAQRVSFVNQVSHELKTPLTNVRMYAELLDGVLSEDELKPKKYLAVIIDESVRLSRLIENVLNFSKMQKNKIPINRKSGVIDHCISHCLHSFAESFNKHGITVEFNARADMEVEFDQAVLEQILNNLLSNAEKYASCGKKIEVSSVIQAGRAIISVRDFGKGIAKKEKKRIFEPFYRINSNLTEGVSGTGIGLNIAQKLAQQHGGTISVKDQNPGCCFTVDLDVSRH